MSESTGVHFNQRLRDERISRRWSQQEVADRIGTTPNNVSRWELGVTTPSPHFRAKLCDLFGKMAGELGLLPDKIKKYNKPPLKHDQPLPSASPSLSVTIWNVPYRRNPFFTGREGILTHLHDALRLAKTVAVSQTQAISGLGGIGKTQVAIEYAYRFRDDYQAVLWVRADTREVLSADFVALADVLRLPEWDVQEQRRAVEAIKRWLNDHLGWLLILDNIGDPTIVGDLLPATPNGHLLLTTRTQTMGTLAERVDLARMEPEEGALLLLRRSRLLPPWARLEEVSASLCNQAVQLSRDMDGLPLALDQVGAYLEETACTLSTYLELYRAQRATLLNRRGAAVVDHPESVTTTFALCIARVEQVNPAAADLLRLCAFLQPDAIPEEIVVEGAPDLGPTFQLVTADSLTLNEALAALRAYSLLQRNPDAKTLTMHRLVQAVLRDSMDETMQRQWAERAAKAVNRAFPDVKEMGVVTWFRCQRCLPQVHICAALIEQWHIVSAEAERLLHQAAIYLQTRAQYAQAEPLYQQALAIRRQLWGPKHPEVAESLNDLALLYHTQGKYAQAEPLYQQALAIRRQLWGPKHPEVAESLNNLASLYRLQGKYAQAEPLYRRALAICERMLGPEHTYVAISLYNLGALYRVQGKYAQAEPLLLRGLAICERMVKSEPPDAATSRNDQADLYVAVGLHHMAELYLDEGKYTEAKSFCQRALAIREKVLGPEHPRVARVLNTLARLYHSQGNYMEAEPAYQRALRIQEKVLGPEHPEVVVIEEGYAGLLAAMKREAESATLLETNSIAIQMGRDTD